MKRVGGLTIQGQVLTPSRTVAEVTWSVRARILRPTAAVAAAAATGQRIRAAGWLPAVTALRVRRGGTFKRGPPHHPVSPQAVG